MSAVEMSLQQAALAILAAWPLDDEGCSQYHMRQFAAYVADHPNDVSAVKQVSTLLARSTPEDAKGYNFAVVLYDIIGYPPCIEPPT